MKKVVYMCILAMMVVCFSGCYDEQKVAEILLVGTIENTIQGVVSKEYRNESDWSDANYGPTEERDEIREEMITYLKGVYGYDDYTKLSVATSGYFNNVYDDILKEFEYSISELENVGEGEYKATITFKPFALGDALDDIAYAFYAEVEEDESASRERQPARIDRELFTLLQDEAEEFAKDIKYSEEMSIDVTITLTDKEWMLSDNYYTEFLANIMDLNIEEEQ